MATGWATVSHQTGPVDMLLPDMHLEWTWFHILISHCHKPHIDWETGVIQEWEPARCLTCLKRFRPPRTRPAADLEASNLEGVSPDYHDLHLVLSKDGAVSLPPH